MTPTVTRIVSAAMSMVGAAGLVAFANPANAVGTASHHAAARPAVSVAATAAPAPRG